MTSTDPTIAALSASAYTVPADGQEGDGTLTWDSTTLVIVEARTADPAAPAGLGWTYAPTATVALIDELLTPAVLGRCAFDIPSSWSAMARATRNAGGGGGLAAMALSAVDVALWDLKARLLELPLHHLFGAARDTMTIYGSGGFTTYDDDRLRAQLLGWVDGGIKGVKIKIGESWGARERRDLNRVALARATIGDQVGLFVDANGGYGRKQAIRVGRQLADFDVTWFEEPVTSQDLDGLRLVRDHVLPDVAAGEYGDTLAYFGRVCAAGALDCLQIDATRCGGYTEWLRASAVAAAHGLEVSGHCAPRLHAPVALATPNARHLEWFHDHARIEAAFFDPPPSVDGGVIRGTDQAGHGLSLRVPGIDHRRTA
jgi:L-alanine-DL-glutamate epimerase-like enolase superfamily enzyme